MTKPHRPRPSPRAGRAISDGTDQSQRVPPALESRRFGVDEAGFAERVATAASLARYLRFVDLAGRDGGDWRRLFEGDESLVLARMAAVDLDALQRELLRDLDAVAPERLALHAVALAQGLDRWWKALDRNNEPAARAMSAQIEQAVAQRLGDDLAWIGAHFDRRSWQGRPVTSRLEGLSPMWRAQPPLPGPSRPARATPERETLRGIGFAFLSTIGALRSFAVERLPDSLASGRHAPAPTLLMAFLQLYGTVQARINSFGERHVEFYYRDCLGLRPAAAQPGSLHLACRREERATPEIVLPDGALFDAGTDPSGQAIELRSEGAATLTQAEVVALCTVRLERDPLIAPERDFGFVTRIKAAEIAVERDPARLAAQPEPPWFAPFGGHLGSALGATNARAGLAIATPVLFLGEGERDVRLHLRVEPDDGGRTLSQLVDGVAGAADLARLRERVGQLFIRWLVAGDELQAGDLVRLRSAARRLLEASDGEVDSVGIDDPLHLLLGEGAPSRQLLFGRLLSGLFELAFTTATGWWSPEAADVSPHPEGGLLFAIRLRREDPAIVACDPLLHGAHWPTRLPVLRLQIGTQGRIYGYSLLSALRLLEANVSVKVEGLQDVVMRNDLGRLDASKPFQPFGPLPTLSSYLVFGAPEIARKHLDALALHLDWSGLPRVAGGFGSWYREYAPTYVPGAPSVHLGILRDGQWQDGAGTASSRALFDCNGPQARLAPRHTISFDSHALRMHTRASRPEALDGPRVQGGLFRLQLAGPEGAFGHAAYPYVLADAVSLQARLRRPMARPNPPYTPVIERLWLDYEASDTVSLLNTDAADDVDEPSCLFHLHPFGLKALRPTAGGSAHAVLPRAEHDGNLMIGIAAPVLRGPLTLLFHLHTADAADPTDQPEAARTQWSYLKDDNWHVLPATRVLSDTTAGLLSTGIVVLDLPAGLDTNNDVMPRGLFWLRLTADSGFDGFAGLHGVRAQAVQASRVLPLDALPAAETGVADTALIAAVEPRRSLAGLAGVVPVGMLTGGRAPQERRHFYAGAGERLQHRQRASTAWDFERLVLERFPRVVKVKCLSAQELGDPPGRVLVVVVPEVPRNVPQQAVAAPRLDARELREIHAYLAARSSPCVRLHVRNAAYERIQVRCTVQPARGAHEGVVLRRVERSIIDYLSPWIDGGCRSRFGWMLRCEDVQAHLRALEGVEAVTRLSLLQVARDDAGVNTLGDTARVNAVARGTGGRLHPRHPWSLAIPMATHLLTTPESAPEASRQATGIRELSIGSTFIVGGATP